MEVAPLDRFRDPGFPLEPIVLLLLLPPLFRLEDEALEEPREFAEHTDSTPECATLTAAVAAFGLCIVGAAGEAEGTKGPRAV